MFGCLKDFRRALSSTVLLLLFWGIVPLSWTVESDPNGCAKVVAKNLSIEDPNKSDGTTNSGAPEQSIHTTVNITRGSSGNITQIKIVQNGITNGKGLVKYSSNSQKMVHNASLNNLVVLHALPQKFIGELSTIILQKY